MRLREQLIKGGIGVIVVKVIGTLLAFVLSIVLARSLGSEGYGIYSFILSILMLLSIPIQAGLPNLAVRETAKALVNNEVQLIKGIWLWILRLSILYFIFLCLFLALFIYFSEDWIDTIRYQTFLTGFVLIPFGALVLTQSAIIRGFGKVVIGTIPDGLIRPGVSLGLISGILFFTPSYEITSTNIMMIHIVSVIVAFLVSLIVLNRLTSHQMETGSQLRMESNSWFRALYPLTIVGGVQLLFGYADVVILGLFRSDMEIGVYKVAVQFSTLVVFGLTVLNQMLQPHFSRLYAEKDMENLQKLVSISSKAIFFLAVFPAMLFIFTGESIINFIYGTEYIVGALALTILVVGQLVNAAFGSVGALLNMTGHEKDSMRGMLIALIANIFLNFALVPLYGMEGAALSTAISLILWNTMLRHYVKKRLDIESSGLVFFYRLRNK